MQLNEFEKHIASNIDGYQSQIDTDSLWDDLENDLDKEKKKKRKVIVLFIGLLAISGLICLGVSSPQFTSNLDSESSSNQAKLTTRKVEPDAIKQGFQTMK